MCCARSVQSREKRVFEVEGGRLGSRHRVKKGRENGLNSRNCYWELGRS